jgi:DNA-binding transcriptional ArsR family regulator
MVKYTESQLDAAFSALADPTRRAIVARLARGSATVSELAQPFDMSLPAVSKHLSVLECADILKRRKEGRTHHCSIDMATLKRAMAWIDRHRILWEGSLDALAEYLEETESTEEKTNAPR